MAAKRNYFKAGQESKICGLCSRELPLTAFPIARTRASGRASHCKECRNTRYRLDSRRHKVKHIRHRYGLELEEYFGMFEKQGYACAICKNTICPNGTAHVDHCHQTKRVRGLLCHSCNTGIGHFKDDTSLLSAAISYLKK